MKSVLRAIDEPHPGGKWGALFHGLWPAYLEWFLREGDGARPGYLTCARALREHMPELVPTYERLVELAGGGDVAARLLSLYRPTPYLTGCSQAVWVRGQPLLVRNYDYSPRLWDAVLLRSAWNGKRVIAMSDCLWGVLDGMNESGLAVSLAFGGRRVVGEGFGIPLVLRYVLEFCDSADQAAEVLRRVPTHMAYNVTVVDATGRHLTVFVAPDHPAVLTTQSVATNHGWMSEWSEYAHATDSVAREHFLSARLEDLAETPDRFIARFLEPPLFSTRFAEGWGTLYTVVYRPLERDAVFYWPTRTLTQSVGGFREATVEITYPGG